MRKVVLLCGPPGAGKSTAARVSGLPVFDRDDDQWGSEAEFVSAIGSLGNIVGAQAVVIRSAPTSSARRAACRLINATHVYLVTGAPDVLAARVRARRRPGMRGELAGIRSWFDRFDHADGAPAFPGWPAIDAPLAELGITSSDW